MNNSLQASEDASAAVAKAPRITKKFIEDSIDRIVFTTGDSLLAGSTIPSPMLQVEGPWDGEGGPAPDEWQGLYSHHTFCLITTEAGFTVIGHSAPADPSNFDETLGRQLAYENGFRQLWPMFAFAGLEFAHTAKTGGRGLADLFD